MSDFSNGDKIDRLIRNVRMFEQNLSHVIQQTKHMTDLYQSMLDEAVSSLEESRVMLSEELEESIGELELQAELPEINPDRLIHLSELKNSLEFAQDDLKSGEFNICVEITVDITSKLVEHIEIV